MLPFVRDTDILLQYVDQRRDVLVAGESMNMGNRGGDHSVAVEIGNGKM